MGDFDGRRVEEYLVIPGLPRNAAQNSVCVRIVFTKRNQQGPWGIPATVYPVGGCLNGGPSQWNVWSCHYVAPMRVEDRWPLKGSFRTRTILSFGKTDRRKRYGVRRQRGHNIGGKGSAFREEE